MEETKDELIMDYKKNVDKSSFIVNFIYYNIN